MRSRPPPYRARPAATVVMPDYADVDREREKTSCGGGRRRCSCATGWPWALAPAPPPRTWPPALARLRLSIRCVAAAPHIEREARALGLIVRPFDSVDHLDIAIDGADQIADDGWLIKGGGAAHTRGEDRRRGGQRVRDHRGLDQERARATLAGPGRAAAVRPGRDDAPPGVGDPA